jgi:hypothetical protein
MHSRVFPFSEAIGGFGNHIIYEIKVRRDHTVRRHDIDGVPQGPQQDAPSLAKRHEFQADSGQVAGVGHLQIEGRDGAQTPDVGKAGIGAEAIKAFFLQIA